uniref:Tafazzin family protein n=1 Tax=Hucho hucho TaxID=62062 RepID=A0A4W5KIS1_9TELE
DLSGFCLESVTPAASDICFTKEFHSRFFSRGKCIPVCRGEGGGADKNNGAVHLSRHLNPSVRRDGVYQKGMDFILEKLNGGDWVHIFPEGTISLALCVLSLTFLTCLYSLGRFPLLGRQPRFHPLFQGGDQADPNCYRPISILPCLSKVLEERMEMRKALTDSIQEEFRSLRTKAEALHQRVQNTT